MKLLGLLAGIAVAAILVATALAQPQESERITYRAVDMTPSARDPVKRVTASTKLAPLKLPNIAALSKQAWKADRKTLARQLEASNNVVRFWHHKGRWITAPRYSKCWMVPWQRSCTIARASLRLHAKLASIAETRLTRELPYTSDWVTAVGVVQRIYPKTRQWLLSCSSGEGGHGGFVMNTEGSGASGWMQYMPGTFYGHAPQAFSHARSLGFILPDQLSINIENPMAQAITAAYMRTHGMSSHWDPRIDPLCA